MKLFGKKIYIVKEKKFFYGSSYKLKVKSELFTSTTTKLILVCTSSLNRFCTNVIVFGTLIYSTFLKDFVKKTWTSRVEKVDTLRRITY